MRTLGITLTPSGVDFFPTCSPLLPHRGALARTAFTMAGRSRPGCVSGVVGVPFRAVRFEKVGSRRRCTTQHVLSNRDRFEMVGIHAVSDTAKMVKDQPIGNWAYVNLVREPVAGVLPRAARAGYKAGVPKTVNFSGPRPALLRAGLVDLEPELFFGTAEGIGHRVPCSVPPFREAL